MPTITIDAAREHEFDGLWDQWTADRRAAARARGPLTEALPSKHGPMPDNRIRIPGLASEFLEFLKSNGFPFSVKS